MRVRTTISCWHTGAVADVGGEEGAASPARVGPGGRRRRVLVVAAALLVVLLAGTVWAAVGRGDNDATHLAAGDGAIATRTTRPRPTTTTAPDDATSTTLPADGTTTAQVATTTSVARSAARITTTTPIGATGTSSSLLSSSTTVPSVGTTPSSAPRPARGTTGDYSFACDPPSLTITAGSSGQSRCTVTSLDGFAGTVQFVCQNPPFHCSVSPTSVEVEAGGQAATTITIPVPGDWGAGSADQQVRSSGGGRAHTVSIHVDVATIRMSCSPPNSNVAPGQTSEAISCDASSTKGWSGSVTFSCDQPPAGITCLFSPSSGSVASGSFAGTSVRFQIDAAVPPGRYFLDVRGTSGSITQFVVHEVDDA
jgi:hypothetical protein